MWEWQEVKPLVFHFPCRPPTMGPLALQASRTCVAWGGGARIPQPLAEASVTALVLVWRAVEPLWSLTLAAGIAQFRAP